MSFSTATYAVVEKDIRSELRTRYALNALLMFVVTAVSTILFALRSDNPSIELLSGMYWVVVFFTAMSVLSRIFVSEEERGTVTVLQHENGRPGPAEDQRRHGPVEKFSGGHRRHHLCRRRCGERIRQNYGEERQVGRL